MYSNLPENLNLLVVDDVPINVNILKRFAQKLNYRVQTARDGQAGLEICSDEKFDLILLDIHMPIMSGLKLAQLLRMGCGINTNTPIVGVTADARDELRDECLSSHFDGWQLKPLRFEALKHEILKVTTNHTSTRK